jgi:hypothetical protein
MWAGIKTCMWHARGARGVPDPDGTPEQPGEAEDVSSEPASITGIPFMMTKDMRRGAMAWQILAVAK